MSVVLGGFHSDNEAMKQHCLLRNYYKGDNINTDLGKTI